MEIARDLGYKVNQKLMSHNYTNQKKIHLFKILKTVLQVEERLIPIEELIKADEIFCTGTAVVIAPVGSITYDGKK